MRIVYLINGLNGGGAAFPMTQVIGLMRELGHDVTVYALMKQDGKAAQRLERDRIPYELIGHEFHEFVRPAVRLVRRLRALRPDVLWTSLTRGTIYGQLAGYFLGIPVVSWQHSAFLKPGNIALLRRLAPLTDRWVADSDSVRDFAQASLRVDPEHIRVWTPFVADPELPAAKAWDTTSRFRFGSLGRLHASKQYAVLIKALARMLELDAAIAGRVELYIAGDGEEQAALQALTRTLKVERAVHFVGFVQQPAAFLAHLHGYIQTSRKEGFCIAAHEAMQAALPVIATRVGELAHSVRPGVTGWLCEVGDVEALARAMLAMARHPDAAANMGLRARAWILDRYSEARFRQTGAGLLDEVRLMSGRAKASATHLAC